MGILDSIFGKKSPRPTDPGKLVEMQEKSARFDIVSPFGGRRFGKTPEGRTQLEITETPFQRRLREAQERGLERFFAQDPEAARARTEEAFFERGRALIEPERERQRRELETSLSLKGVPIGSEAFQEQTGELARRQSEELQQLARLGILAGGEEARASRRARLGELTTDVTGRQFLQTAALNVPSVDVAGIFQRADALNLQRSEAENLRRRKRIFDISRGISAAFLPGDTKEEE